MKCLTIRHLYGSALQPVYKIWLLASINHCRPAYTTQSSQTGCLIFQGFFLLQNQTSFMNPNTQSKDYLRSSFPPFHPPFHLCSGHITLNFQPLCRHGESYFFFFQTTGYICPFLLQCEKNNSYRKSREFPINVSIIFTSECGVFTKSHLTQKTILQHLKQKSVKEKYGPAFQHRF